MSLASLLNQFMVTLVPPAPPAVPVGIFNVMSYGAQAIGGGFDDSVGIQKAIDAAQKAGSGTVYFPVGQYNLLKPLQIVEA